MPYKLTKGKADEFHKHCPSGTKRHSMRDYRQMLEDGKFDVSNANRRWLEAVSYTHLTLPTILRV